MRKTLTLMALLTFAFGYVGFAQSIDLPSAKASSVSNERESERQERQSEGHYERNREAAERRREES